MQKSGKHLKGQRKKEKKRKKGWQCEYECHLWGKEMEIKENIQKKIKIKGVKS